MMASDIARGQLSGRAADTGSVLGCTGRGVGEPATGRGLRRLRHLHLLPDALGVPVDLGILAVAALRLRYHSVRA